MEPGSRKISLLAILFLCCYFLVFAGGGLNAYFTFDDGMNLIHLHRMWEVPITTNILAAIKVFTAEYRPLGALFYRPLYALFGFHPLPFRIVCYLLMIFNIVLAYRFARVLGASAEASLLSTFLGCYNASMMELYYNSGTIYDLLCFAFYIGAVVVYARARARGGQLSFAVMLLVLLMFLAALDAKEMGATLPAALLLYEVLYRHRDYRSLRSCLCVGGFLLVLFAAAAAFLRVKVAYMGTNAFYHPELTTSSVLRAIGHYVEQLLFLQPEACGPAALTIAVGVLLACAVLFRSPAIAYGTLFFLVGLVPLTVIVLRTGYAAYVAYPGLTLAVATLLVSARAALMRMSGKEQLRRASAVALFLCVAVVWVISFAHTRKIFMANTLWDEQRRIDFLAVLKRRIPEFPPDTRILLTDDVWPSDWGPMFLAELMYHDPSLWMDRFANAETGPRDSYDLLMTYREPLQRTLIPRLLGVRKRWELHWVPYRQGELTITAPDSSRAPRDVSFSPSVAPAGSSVTLRVPGIANVGIDVVRRIVSNGTSAAGIVEGWCMLDAQGACTVSAPRGGQLNVDWVRPSKGRWILTNGQLSIR